jgi:hypothetical protein
MVVTKVKESVRVVEITRKVIAAVFIVMGSNKVR